MTTHFVATIAAVTALALLSFAGWLVGVPVPLLLMWAPSWGWVIVANVFLGERLRDGQNGVYEALGVTVTREFRPTKEYPRGQEVYALTFDENGSDLDAPDETPSIDPSP